MQAGSLLTHHHIATHPNNRYVYAMKSDPATWVDSYADTLYRYALLKTANPAVAEDLVQETLIAALKGHDSFMERSSEKTWMIGILKHKVMDYFRSQTREFTSTTDEDPHDYDSILFDDSGHWRNPLSPWKDPDQALENQDFLNILQACIDNLPARHAEAFMLSEFRDLESDAVCKLLDISSTNNLWVLLSRVRARLRDCLDNNWFRPSRGQS